MQVDPGKRCAGSLSCGLQSVTGNPSEFYLSRDEIIRLERCDAEAKHSEGLSNAGGRIAEKKHRDGWRFRRMRLERPADCTPEMPKDARTAYNVLITLPPATGARNNIIRIREILDDWFSLGKLERAKGIIRYRRS